MLTSPVLCILNIHMPLINQGLIDKGPQCLIHKWPGQSYKGVFRGMTGGWKEQIVTQIHFSDCGHSDVDLSL